MKTFKVILLTCLITAAVVYVGMQWKRVNPLASAEISRDLDDEENSNVTVYQKYSAGIVNITSQSVEHDFFLHPVTRESGTGSGVVINDQGYILTNFHVIQGFDELEVTLADRSRHPARVIGFDVNNDLALLKIDGKGRLTPIPIGNSKTVRVGQKVLAIGNPYGLQRTLTTGIISSLGREIESPDGRIIEDIIQTDAAINPGNSGGPLLNTRGEMIGLNTAILSPANSGNIGIGFAVSASTIQRVVDDLMMFGYVRRPYLGIRSISLSQYSGLAEGLKLNTNTGLLILSVDPNSPAGRAGIRGASEEVIIGNYEVPAGGDVIVAVDGHALESTEHLSSAIDRYKPGDRVTITVLRDTRQLDIPVVLGETP